MLTCFFLSGTGCSSLSSLWRRIMIGPPRDKDLLAIVKAWYPEVEPLAEQLIGRFYYYLKQFVQAGSHFI